MKKETLVIGSGVAVLLLAIGLVFLFGKKPVPVESTWSARFGTGRHGDYGVRFRTEPPPAKLAPAAHLSVTAAPPLPAYPDRSEFDIHGAPTYRRTFPIAGDPEPPMPATGQVIFSNGASVKLRAILAGGFALTGASRDFAWGMSPDGRLLTKAEIDALVAEIKTAMTGYRGHGGGPESDFQIFAVFDLQGGAKLSFGALSEATTGVSEEALTDWPINTPTHAVLQIAVARWQPMTRELIFHAFGGTPQTAELATTPGAQAHAGPATVTHSAAFPSFSAPRYYVGEDSHLNSGTFRFSIRGKDHGTAHFIGTPADDDQERYDIVPKPPMTAYEAYYRPTRFKGLRVAFTPGPPAPDKVFQVSRLPEARRIRMTLPAFPKYLAPAGADEPLDWPIPAAWDRNKVTVDKAAWGIAKLHYRDMPWAVSKIEKRTLSEFPGKNTLREVLAEALREDLQLGHTLIINDHRQAYIEQPMPTRWQKFVSWVQVQSKRIFP